MVRFKCDEQLFCGPVKIRRAVVSWSGENLIISCFVVQIKYNEQLFCGPVNMWHAVILRSGLNVTAVHYTQHGPFKGDSDHLTLRFFNLAFNKYL